MANKQRKIELLESKILQAYDPLKSMDTIMGALLLEADSVISGGHSGNPDDIFADLDDFGIVTREFLRKLFENVNNFQEDETNKLILQVVTTSGYIVPELERSENPLKRLNELLLLALESSELKANAEGQGGINKNEVESIVKLERVALYVINWTYQEGNLDEHQVDLLRSEITNVVSELIEKQEGSESGITGGSSEI
jgi:hypothetical protein